MMGAATLLRIQFMNEFSEAEKICLKKELQQRCITVLEQRIATADQAMDQAQEAANSEEKSSAGDKYETSRAMGQLSRDMNAKQLEEARRDLAFVKNLQSGRLFNSAQAGSVVIVEGITFFISLGLGTIDLHDSKVVLISPTAPVALQLEGKKAGDTFAFRGNDAKILDIF